jgi:hypothetical protein
LLAEYTVKSNKLSEHLKKKVFLYQKALANPEEFVDFIKQQFPAVAAALTGYDAPHCQIRFIYCPETVIDDELRAEVPQTKFFDIPTSMYFKSIAETVKFSGMSEFLSFLDVSFENYGDNVFNIAGANSEPFEGSVLPRAHSNIGDKFTVMSFYISPDALLKRAYVLRRDGWRDSDWLYQRMIDRKKVGRIRQFLNEKRRVFLNNIIVTLPSGTKILDRDNNTINVNTIKKTEPARISLPLQSNTVGLIDGQHRVFAYHEGGRFEEEISGLRKKLNLLVTGVLFPADLSELDRMRFEAELFLEINSNQSSAKSELRQSIQEIVNPFSGEAIARKVLVRMNRGGRLKSSFVTHYFDGKRLKTTSIVSYGLRHLVALKGEDSLVKFVDTAVRDGLEKREEAALTNYIRICADVINAVFLGIKLQVPSERWTFERTEENRILSTTFVNGILNVIRQINMSGTNPFLCKFDNVFSGIDPERFKKYKSSQYGQLGRELYADYKSNILASSES